MELSLEQLKQFCQEYDKQYGKSPESYYEGKSLFIFIREQLTGQKDDQFSFKEDDEWEAIVNPSEHNELGKR